MSERGEGVEVFPSGIAEDRKKKIKVANIQDLVIVQ